MLFTCSTMGIKLITLMTDKSASQTNKRLRYMIQFNIPLTCGKEIAYIWDYGNGKMAYFSKEELDDMAIYPDDGGVKLINGIIVVKFDKETAE